MKNLIYYPSFEPTNIDWIKYALIHIDEFSPIIPESGKTIISNLFRRINNDTDLIRVHKPEWRQGDNAATKALKEIEFIEKHPEQYRDKLQKANIIRTWTDKRNWDFKLYEEKFNIPFKYECIEKGIGIECDGGLMTSKELAEFYMTFLAEEIAFEKQGNPITDSKEMNNLSTYLRSKNPKNEQLLKAASTTIKTSLPKNIENISIEKLIQFRNDSGVSELRKSFNENLDSFYNALEEDFDPVIYLENLKRTNSELTKEVILFFGGATASVLGGLILVKNPDNLELTKQVLEGTLLMIGGLSSINKAWGEGDNRRHARKFINKIKEI